MKRTSWGIAIGVVGFFVLTVAVPAMTMGGGAGDAPVTATPAPTPEPTATPSVGEELAKERQQIEQAILEAINERRGEAGVRPVAMAASQRAIAREHSTDMLERGYYNHTAPDGQTFLPSCRPTAEVIMKAELDIGEHERNAKHVADSWMGSNRHREILLQPNWNRIGVGVALNIGGGDGDGYVTANFC